MDIRRMLLLVLAVLVPAQARSWSAKLHVYSANEILRDAVDGELDLGSFGTVEIDSALVETLRLYPEYFRAGAIGPDGYPDIFVGQAFTHPDFSAGLVESMLDNGSVDCDTAVLRGWCGACTPPATAGARWCEDPVDSGVPGRWKFEGLEFARPRKFWRSIDWAKNVFDAAQHELWCMKRWSETGSLPTVCGASGELPATLASELHAAGGRPDIGRVNQSLAFAYGYLLHFPGDGFGHNWVNQYAGGAWDYFDEHPEYEYRHVIVERFVSWAMVSDARATPLPADTTENVLATPNWFIVKYLMAQPVADEYGEAPGTDSAGASAAHIRYLFAYRDLLLKIKAKYGIPDRLEPTGVELPDGEVAPVFDARNPGSYSSVWSYMVNYCFEAFAFEAAAGSRQNCVEDLFRVTFASFILDRLAAVDRALLDWAQLSTDINRELISDDFSLGDVRALLATYWQNDVYTLFLPPPGSDVRDYFGLSCDDVGPPNFANLCVALSAPFRDVVETELQEVDAAARVRFASYFDAYDRFLCTLDWIVDKWTEPATLMNIAYCSGSEHECPESAVRKRQILADLFLDGNDGRTFPPFKNTVDLGKLVLLKQAKMASIASLANALDLAGVPLIDLASPTGFVAGEAYDRIIWESVASLDGTQPMNEESTDWDDPNRVLFDQFRKPPVFVLVKDAASRNRVHWPLFGIDRQDPDGDQIYLGLDSCPCVPQTRATNAQDRDADGVGDACDAETIASIGADTVRALPDAGFGPPSLGIKTSFTNRLDYNVGASCERDSSAAAQQQVDTMFAEVNAHVANGIMDAPTGTAVLALLQDLHDRFASGGVYCAEMPQPGKVTSCGP